MEEFDLIDVAKLLKSLEKYPLEDDEYKTLQIIFEIAEYGHSKKDIPKRFSVYDL